MSERFTQEEINSFITPPNTSIPTSTKAPVNIRKGKSITEKFERYSQAIVGLTSEGRTINPDVSLAEQRRKRENLNEERKTKKSKE